MELNAGFDEKKKKKKKAKPLNHDKEVMVIKWCPIVLVLVSEKVYAK